MMRNEFQGGDTNPSTVEPHPYEVIVGAILATVWWLLVTAWNFRAFTGTVGLLAAGAWYLHPYLAAVAVLCLIPPMPSATGEEWRRSLRRFRLARWRRNWNRYAMKLGWARRYDQTVHTPTLTRIELDDQVTIVELQPLSNHRFVMWPEMTDALRRLTSHPQATWRETRPGHLEITLHRQPLPELLELDPRSIGAHEAEVHLGVRADTQPLCWNVDHSPHLLVAGATGGGKGSVIRLVIAHGLKHRWQTTIINPKRSGEFAWTIDHGAQVVKDLDQTEQHLSAVVTQMRHRQDQLDAAGVETWHDQPWRRQLVVVDEAPALLTGATDKTLRTDVATHLNQIAAMGRSAGIHLVIVAQRADTQALGQHGGQLRNNIAARIAVGSLDQQGRQMLFNTLNPDIERTLTGIKGRALATQLNVTHGVDVIPAQIAWISPSQLARATEPHQ